MQYPQLTSKIQIESAKLKVFPICRARPCIAYFSTTLSDSCLLLLRLPKLPKKVKAYHIGYFHVDFTELRLAHGKRYLFVAIDRTSELAFAKLHPVETAKLAAAFWQYVVQAAPYTITKVLTGNGVQFTQLPHRRSLVAHLFDAVCTAHGIEHRCTQVAHPWTNGQVGRLNRTLKEATIQQYHY